LQHLLKDVFHKAFSLFYKIMLLHVNKNGEVKWVNPLSPELNPICYLLALLAHDSLHVSRQRVKSLTLRLLMSYIYGEPILDISRSHTTTQHSR
jgi:transposase